MSDKRVAELSFEFALKVIDLYKRLLESKEYVVSKQLLRSATSIGANIEEASAAFSRNDFVYRMCIASKEARETRYWLKLLASSKLVVLDFKDYLQDIEVIIKMLTKIVKTLQVNS